MPDHLRKVTFNTKLPKWLRDWLTAPGQEKSAPVLIEEALQKAHGITPKDPIAPHFPDEPPIQGVGSS